MSEGSGVGTSRRRSVEQGDIGPIAERYLDLSGCRFTEESEDRNGNRWWRGECPGCGHKTYGACLEWGKAGCSNDACKEIPSLEKWQEVTERIEGLQNPEAAGPGTAEEKRERHKRLKLKALEIVADYEESQRQQREAQEQAEAQEQQRKEQQRLRQDQAEQAHQTAQNAEEQKILDDYRAGEEERRKKQEHDRKQREWQGRADRSESTIKQVLLARSVITPGEVLMSGAWALVTMVVVYSGLWWLQPLLGNVNQISQSVPGELAAYRLPAGLLVGSVVSLAVWRKLSWSRRERWALHGDEEGEHVGLYRYADGEENPVQWLHHEADGSELTTGPAKRFIRGSGRATVATLKVPLGFVAEAGAAIWKVLAESGLPWGGIIGRVFLAAVAVFGMCWVIGVTHGREWAWVAVIFLGPAGMLWAVMSACDNRRRPGRR